MQTNIIVNDDSIEYMKSLPDNSIDLIFADPPYWMRVEGVLNRVEGTEFDGCQDDWDQFNTLDDYNEFTKNWLSECYRILKNDGSFWVIGGMQCIYSIGGIMQELGFWFINDVIWYKSNPTPNFAGTRLTNSHETLIWATKSKKSKFCFHYKTGKELNHENVSDTEYDKGIRKQMGSVWRFPVCSGNERLKDGNGEKLHSTQKPEEMLYRIIALTSDEKDIVLDPFGGTMTTAAVAKKMGRQYIAIEQDKKYVEYGQKRLDEIKEYVPDDITTAKADEKPLPAKMPDMIAAGYFKVNEKLFMPDFIDIDDKDNLAPKLRDDGKIVLPDGTIGDMHSYGAKVRNVKANRINGFDYWQVLRNGKLASIKDIREEYRKSLKIKELNKNS